MRGKATMIKEALILRKHGDYPTARKKLKRFQQTNRNKSHKTRSNLELLHLDLLENNPPTDIIAAVNELKSQWERDGYLTGKARLVLGIAQNRLAQPGRALDTLIGGLHICVENAGQAPFDALKAEILLEIGKVHAWRGDSEYAVLYLSRALAAAIKLNDDGDTFSVLMELGQLNLEEGRHQVALEFFETAQRVSKSWLRGNLKARLLNKLGQAFLGLDAFDQARNSFKKSEAELEKVPSPYLSFLNARFSAISFIRAGQFSKADAKLKRARRILGKGLSSYERLALNLAEGEFLARREDPKAVKKLEACLQETIDRDLAAPEIEVRILLGRALAREGYPYSAEQHLLAALKLARKRQLLRRENEIREAIAHLEFKSTEIEERPRQLFTTPPRKTAKGYVLREELGRGSFGAVYRALDLERGREVALKRFHLPPDIGAVQREKIIKSAKRELEIAARFEDERIVPVLSFSQEDESHFYLVQDYIAGQNLRGFVEAMNPPPEVLCGIFKNLAEALSLVHRGGVIHRDMKPENVIIKEGATPVLIDFGIAHFREASRRAADRAGSPLYVAPEQLKGKKIDGRADIYSIGLIMAEFLLSLAPQEISSFRQSIFKRGLPLSAASSKKKSTNSGKTNQSHKELIRWMIDKNPRKRPSDAAVVAEEIARFLQEK